MTNGIERARTTRRTLDDGRPTDGRPDTPNTPGISTRGPESDPLVGTYLASLDTSGLFRGHYDLVSVQNGQKQLLRLPLVGCLDSQLTTIVRFPNNVRLFNVRQRQPPDPPRRTTVQTRLPRRESHFTHRGRCDADARCGGRAADQGVPGGCAAAGHGPEGYPPGDTHPTTHRPSTDRPPTVHQPSILTRPCQILHSPA